MMEGFVQNNQISKQRLSPKKSIGTSYVSSKQNQVGTVMLYGIPIVSLVIESQERLCLAQISNTLLKQYSYNEIHNRRVALGITCVQCTPVQLEILRRAGAMPVSSRRCGMITRREAERLCKSFLGDNAPPRLPDDFAFSVHHECAWGCRGAFLPSRYNSSRAKCIKCTFCGLFFSPNKFIFHSHRTTPNATYVQPDAANFNSWRRHMKLSGSPPDDVVHAWEDVKAMFNGGTRKRLLASSPGGSSLPIRSSVTNSIPITIASNASKQIKLDSTTPTNTSYPTPTTTPIGVGTPPRVPPFSDLALPISMMDYVWHNGVNSEGIKQFSFAPYTVPWFENAKRSVLGLPTLSSAATQQDSILQHLCSSNNTDKLYHHSAFRPVFPAFSRPEVFLSSEIQTNLAKRHLNSEELILSKKKCLRDADRIDSVSSGDLNEAQSISCRNGPGSSSSLSDVPNPEKDFTKSSGTCRSHFSETNGGVKINLKKEMIFNETSNDSVEMSKMSVFKSRGKQDGKDMGDVTKLLSLKSSLIDDAGFKFREFSPNLLEAISNLKTEDRGAYAGTLVKTYQDVAGEKQRTLQADDCKKKKGIDMESEGDASEDGDDDEPVDVETTDDFPANDRPPANSQDGHDRKETMANTNEDTKGSIELQENVKSDRIWTIAKFSVEKPENSITTTLEGEKNYLKYIKTHNSNIL